MKKPMLLLIWPPLILNVAGVLVVFGLVAYQYATGSVPDGATPQVSYGQTQFALSMLIVAVEWAFAGWLIVQYRQTGVSLRTLFGQDGRLLGFRWKPAVALFVVYNVVFAAYMGYVWITMPDLSYRGMSSIQIGLFIVLLPATAGFTEELIWRGYLIGALENAGRNRWAAIWISSVSFMLIHGVFFPDKLVVTLIIGLITGYYYSRERSLLPLIATHWLVDVWSFGIFFLR